MGELRDIEALREQVRLADGPSRRLDATIACRFIFTNLTPAKPDDFGGKYGFSEGNIKCEHGFLMANRYTSSIDAAVGLVERLLPGWWWSIGHCQLTNDATLAPAGGRIIGPGDAINSQLGPDFRVPRMDELLAKRPELDDGIDVARVGGNVPLAIIEALLSALLVLKDEAPAP